MHENVYFSKGDIVLTGCICGSSEMIVWSDCARIEFETVQKRPRVSIPEPSDGKRLTKATQTKNCPPLSNEEECYNKGTCIINYYTT